VVTDVTAVPPSAMPFRGWLPFARLLTRGLFALFGPVKVVGAYRVPKEGGVLILANHRSDVDPLLAYYAAPRPVHFMAKSELFDIPIVGKLMRGFGAFPVKRGEPDRQALKNAASLLKDGEAVGIFPEGQLSETGELQELKAGVALVIRMAGTPVICCGLTNTERIIPYGKLVPRRAWKTVRAEWGEPHTFGKDVPAEEILAWITGQFRMLAEYPE